MPEGGKCYFSMFSVKAKNSVGGFRKLSPVHNEEKIEAYLKGLLKLLKCSEHSALELLSVVTSKSPTELQSKPDMKRLFKIGSV